MFLSDSNIRILMDQPTILCFVLMKGSCSLKCHADCFVLKILPTCMACGQKSRDEPLQVKDLVVYTSYVAQIFGNIRETLPALNNYKWTLSSLGGNLFI